MANQQLIDYVKGQTLAGVSSADIRKILKDAGWPDAEIEEGMSGAKPAAQSGPVSGSASPFAASSGSSSMPSTASSFTSSPSSLVSSKPSTPTKIEIKVEPKKESAGFDFMGGSSVSSPAMPMGVSGIVKDVAKDNMKETKNTAAFSSSVVSGSPAEKKYLLPWIIAGASLALLVGGGIYFYMSANPLSSQVDSLTASNSALESQVAELKKSGAASAEELNTLRADSKELSDELGLFVIPQASLGKATSFSLSGTVGLSSKLQYTFLTPKGLLLYVKNSKDTKVDSVLKPLIGATALLGGMHVPGSFEITISTVNGSDISTSTVSGEKGPSTSSASGAQ